MIKLKTIAAHLGISLSSRSNLLEIFVKLGIAIVVVYFLAGFIIFPLIWTVYTGFLPAIKILFNSDNNFIFVAVSNSLLLGLLSALTSGFIGVILAYALFFKRNFAERWLFLVLLFPLASPSLVGAMAFHYLTEAHGLINNLFFDGKYGLGKFHGWWAIIIVHTYSFYPIFILFTVGSLKKWNAHIAESAELLGANKISIFFTLLLPHIWRAVVSAALLVFLSAVASYTAPLLYGEEIPFLSIQIFQHRGDPFKSPAYSTILLIICFAVPLLVKIFRRDGPANKDKGGTKQFVPTGKVSWFSSLLCWAFGLMVMLPFLSLVYISLVPESALSQKGISHSFSLQNYYYLFGNANLTDAIVYTGYIAASTVILVLIVGIFASYISYKRGILGKLAETISLLPNGIPSVVLAICFIITFKHATIFTPGVRLVGTFILLPLAFAVKNLPVFTQAISEPLKEVLDQYKEPSYLLGASRLKTLMKVVFPILKPILLYGIVLVIISSMEEFVITNFFRSGHIKTISTSVYDLYNSSQGDQYTLAAAIGVLQTMFVLTLLATFNRRGSLLPSNQ